MNSDALRAADAYGRIEKLGGIPDLRDWLASARREFNRLNPDLQWHLRNPFGSLKSSANEFSELTELSSAASLEAILQAKKMSWTAIALVEICKCADWLEGKSKDHSDTLIGEPEPQSLPFRSTKPSASEIVRRARKAVGQ